jgi:uncharacterized protein YpmB
MEEDDLKKFFRNIKNHLNICILVVAIIAVLMVGGYIYFKVSHVPDNQDATEEQIEEAVQATKEEDYDKLEEMYETADAMIDTLDLSEEDKEKKHKALKAYGDAIMERDLSESQAEEFADLIADIEEVAGLDATGENSGNSTEDTSGTGNSSGTEDTQLYDESYLDQDGNMHYMKKLSAEEFYNYEVRFKGVDEETAKKSMDQNIASGWTELYVPVDENGNYINE